MPQNRKCGPAAPRAPVAFPAKHVFCDVSSSWKTIYLQNAFTQLTSVQILILTQRVRPHRARSCPSSLTKALSRHRIISPPRKHGYLIETINSPVHTVEMFLQFVEGRPTRPGTDCRRHPSFATSRTRKVRKLPVDAQKVVWMEMASRENRQTRTDTTARLPLCTEASSTRETPVSALPPYLPLAP